VCVKLVKLYVVKHNCVTSGVFNDHIMDHVRVHAYSKFLCSPRQHEDGQYRPKHVVVHYIVIKYTSCDTVVFDYIQFSKFVCNT